MLQAEEIRRKGRESSETTTQAHRQHQIDFLWERSIALAQANQDAQHKATYQIDRQCSPWHTQPMDRLTGQVSKIAKRTAYSATKHDIKKIFKHDSLFSPQRYMFFCIYANKNRFWGDFLV